MNDRKAMEYSDETFDSLTWGKSPLQGRVFRDCRFESCDFSEADLRRSRWIDCTFRRCNLSNANVANAAFKTVHFDTCKLLGVDFGTCDKLLLELSFHECDLSYALFSELDQHGFSLTGSRLRDAEFLRCTFPEANFDGSDFSGARIVGCDLRGADFRSATGYAFDPRDNRIEKARFDATGIRGLLEAFGVVIE